MQETPRVFLSVVSRTFRVNLFLYMDAKVASKAPTAEHSTKLAIPIKNNPVIDINITNGIIPAVKSFSFSLSGISLSFLLNTGPNSG